MTGDWSNTVEGDGFSCGGLSTAAGAGAGVAGGWGGACVCRWLWVLSAGGRWTCKGKEADFGSGGGVVLRCELLVDRWSERSLFLYFCWEDSREGIWHGGTGGFMEMTEHTDGFRYLSDCEVGMRRTFIALQTVKSLHVNNAGIAPLRVLRMRYGLNPPGLNRTSSPPFTKSTNEPRFRDHETVAFRRPTFASRASSGENGCDRHNPEAVENMLRRAQGDGSSISEPEWWRRLVRGGPFLIGRPRTREREMYARVLRIAVIVLIVIVETTEVLAKRLLGEICAKRCFGRVSQIGCREQLLRSGPKGTKMEKTNEGRMGNAHKQRGAYNE